jgi:site-specific recombinase XerC
VSQNYCNGFLVWPQNQVGYDLLVVPQNRWEDKDDTGHVSRSKQVGLGISSLALRLSEARRGWCIWHHRGGYVEMKLKTDWSMR